MRGVLLAVAAFTLLAVLGAASAAAELTAKGDLLVRFAGGIAPRALPRHSLAPVSVRIEGTIRAPASHDPPALRKISIALNRAGRLDTRGLPVCRRSRIASTDTAEALAACGPALVGSGGITAKTSFPEQPTYLLRGEMLLFNGLVGARPAILAHIFQREPVPVTRIVVFRIRRSSGAFGTVIDATLPKSLNRSGYMKTIYMQLQRRFVFRGRQRSYLSASCAAPEGLGIVSFPFAHASMTFDDGRTLSAMLVRSCRAR